MLQVGILTVSDRASRGESEDRSGPLIASILQDHLQVEVMLTATVPDDRQQIAEQLRRWCDDEKLDLILTTGGTGFAPRDITPEATREIIQRPAPGFAEAMRAASLHITPHAMLSRATAGIRERTLIINLPGSPKAVRENLEVILPALPHAIELLRQEAAVASYQHARAGEHQ